MNSKGRTASSPPSSNNRLPLLPSFSPLNIRRQLKTSHTAIAKCIYLGLPRMRKYIFRLTLGMCEVHLMTEDNQSRSSQPAAKRGKSWWCPLHPPIASFIAAYITAGEKNNATIRVLDPHTLIKIICSVTVFCCLAQTRFALPHIISRMQATHSLRDSFSSHLPFRVPSHCSKFTYAFVGRCVLFLLQWVRNTVFWQPRRACLRMLPHIFSVRRVKLRTNASSGVGRCCCCGVFGRINGAFGRKNLLNTKGRAK